MFCYLRKVQYYETDKMGITHHANYIRWMEEARVAFLESIDLPFTSIEEMGIASPVTGVSVDYKRSCTFGDEVEIAVRIEKYDGVRLEVGYEFKNAITGELIAGAHSQHCFLKEGRVCSLKREKLPIHDKLLAASVQGE